VNTRDYRDIDPARPKDWRWNEALEHVNSSAGNHRYPGNDTWIREAAVFIRRQRAIADKFFRTDVSKRKLTSKLRHRYPYLSIAHGIFTDGKQIRWALEAYILCRTPISELADKIGTSQAVIEYYKRLFFDVDSRLDRPMYIYSEILGPAVLSGTDSKDFDYYWKQVAYNHGSEVLGLIINGSSTMTSAQQADFNTRIKRDATRNAFRAASTRSVNNYTANDIINEYVNLTTPKPGAATKSEEEARQYIEEGLFTIADSAKAMPKKHLNNDPGLLSAVGRMAGVAGGEPQKLLNESDE